MSGILIGFLTIGAVIASGALLAQLGMLNEDGQNTLARLAFFVTVPALLLVTISQTDIAELFSTGLIAMSIGLVVPAMVYVGLATRVWGRNLGETTIGVMSSTYVNAGNLGIPVASYVLGNAAYIAPMLLFQLIFVQPVCLAFLDADARGRFSFKAMVMRPIRNPLTLAAFVGCALAAGSLTLPTIVEAPLELLAGMAVPSMLLAYGAALRLGRTVGRDGNKAELFTTTILKLAGQPLIAWFVAAELLGIQGHTLLVIVIASGLPTAQNIFIHAVQHQRAVVLARDTILLTTIGAVPAMIVTVLLLR